MNSVDLIRRPELGLNKILLYSRSKKYLTMMDPQAELDEPAREVPAQKPPFPGALSAPLKVFFSITRQCNLNCPMCFTKDRTYQQPMLSGVDMRKLIAELGTMGVLEIRLTGGEPTNHPEFFNLVKWIDDAGINISLNTHGAYSLRKLARLIESPVGDFHISVDGPAEIHESIRGPKTFKRTVKSIRELRKAGKYVRINTIVFQNNKHLLDEMIQLAESVQAPIRFCPMRAIGRAKVPGFADQYLLTMPEWQQVTEYLARQARHASVKITCFSNNEIEDFNTCEGRYAPVDRAKCGAWLTQMGIDAEGEAYAGGCIDDIPKSLSVGSVLKTPLNELWARAARHVRDYLQAGFPRCAQCSPELLWQEWGRQLSEQAADSVHLF